MTPEQQARDILERMDIADAQVVAMAIELSSKEGAIEIKDRLIAAQQQQIAVYQGALRKIKHPDYEFDHPCPCEQCQQIDTALAQPFDTSALERYRDEVLEELQLMFIKWYVSEREARFVFDSTDKRDEFVKLMIGAV